MAKPYLVCIERPRVFCHRITVNADSEAQAVEYAKQQCLDTGVAEADEVYDEALVVVDIAELYPAGAAE